jgi:hypothetical protein
MLTYEDDVRVRLVRRNVVDHTRRSRNLADRALVDSERTAVRIGVPVLARLGWASRNAS